MYAVIPIVPVHILYILQLVIDQVVVWISVLNIKQVLLLMKNSRKYFSTYVELFSTVLRIATEPWVM